MTTAPCPDPFEESARINRMLDDVFEGSEFGYTDPDVIEREVAAFAKILAGTPSAER